MTKKVKVALLVIVGLITSIVGIVVLIFAGGYLLLSALGACENSSQSSEASPDGTYTAHTFVKDCGATTAESYQLSILKSGKELKNKGGNTFVSMKPFDVEWTSDKALTVTYPASAQNFEMDKKVGKVNVIYVEK